MMGKGLIGERSIEAYLQKNIGVFTDWKEQSKSY